MAAGVSDGAIIIDTQLDNSGFIRDAGQFRNAVNGLRNAVNQTGRSMADSANGYVQAMSRAGSAARTAAGSQSALQKEIARTEAAIERMEARQTKMRALAEQRAQAQRDALRAQIEEEVKSAIGYGNWELMPKWSQDQAMEAAMRDFEGRLAAIQSAPVENTDAWRSLQYDIDQAREKLEGLNAAFSGLEQAQDIGADAAQGLSETTDAGSRLGSAFSAVAQRAGAALAALGRFAGHAAIGFLRRLASGAKNAAIQLAKLAGRGIQAGLRNIGKLAGGAARKLFGMGQSAKQSNGGFGSALKMMLRYGLGIRSLFVLFNRLRSAVKESFESLMKYDPRVKASLGALSTSLNTLKGSLAPAFAPILNAVTPALVALINTVTRATNAVGMFMAALTGQSYYTAAQGVSSIGTAASGSTKEVKDLKRQLASFDELNILGAKDSGSSGGASSGETPFATYATVPIDSGIQNFVERLKALAKTGDWDGIGRVIADGLNGAFTKARELVKWDNVGGVITEYVGRFTSAFNGLVDGIDWAGVGNTIGEGINTILYTFGTLLDKLDLAALGRRLADALNGLVNTVNFGKLGETLAAKLTAKLVVIGNALARFDWEKFGPKLAEGFNRFFKKLDEVVGGIDWPGIVQRFTRGVNKFIAHIDWRELGDTLGRRAGTLVESLKAAVTEFKWGDTGTKFADALNEFFSNKQLFEDAGSTIDGAIRGLLDFTKRFVITFDAKQAAQRIKDALERIEWDKIASDFWATATAMFNKAGDFLTVLFGGELEDPNVSRMMRDKGVFASSTSSKIASGLSDLAVKILNAIKSAFDSIPWDSWGDKIHDFLISIKWADVANAFWDAIVAGAAGLGKLIVSALFGSDSDIYKSLFPEGTTPTKSTGNSGLANLARLYAGVKIGKWTLGSLLGGTGSSAAAGASAGGLLQIGGIAALAKSAWDNIVGIVNSTKEYSEAGYGNPLEQLLGGIETFYGKNGLGFEEHVRQALNALFDPIGIKNVGDKVLETLGINKTNSGGGGQAGSVGAGRDKRSNVVQNRSLLTDDELINTGKMLQKTGASVDQIVGTLAKTERQAYVLRKALEANSKATDQNTTTTDKKDNAGFQTVQIGTNAEFQADWKEQFGDGFEVDANVNFQPNVAGGSAYRNNGLLGYLKQLFAPGVDTQTRVTLVKHLWDTVYGFVNQFSGGNVGKFVDLLSNFGSTVLSWVNGRSGGNAQKWIDLISNFGSTVLSWVNGRSGGNAQKWVDLISNFGSSVLGWVNGRSGGNAQKWVDLISNFGSSVLGWVNGMSGGNTQKLVDLVSNFGSTVLGWVDEPSRKGGHTGVQVDLIRLWKTVSGWVNDNKGTTPVDQNVGLSKIWSSVAGWILASFMGGDVEKFVGLTNSEWGSGWTSVVAWVKERLGNGDVDQPVGLMGKGWSYVVDWVNKHLGGNATAGVDLTNSGTNWAKGIVWFLTKGKDIILGVSLAIKSVTGAVASIVNAILGKAEGGIVTAMGRSLAFASGGVISGGMARFLEGVPHYARGTTRAHGTLFVAGEAGPEIMGHINGRTEILNKSQLAQTMYGAVTSGMAAALRGLTFRMPAMATGGVMPYGVSAQIARTGLELQSTLDANNEDLIQTIISVIGAQTTAIVAALQAVERSAGGSGGALGVQSVINEINRRTQMFSASPLKGV